MKANKIMFNCSCILFALSALSLLLTVAGNFSGKPPEIMTAVIAASLFWGGLLSAIVLLVIVNLRRKADKNKPNDKKQRVGAFCFFSNKIAMIFDVLTAVFFIAFVVTMFIPSVSDYISLILVVLFLISAYMHSMLNGVNFKYIYSAK